MEKPTRTPVRVGFLRSSQRLCVLGEKLQRVLYGVKRTGIPEGGRHPLFHRRHGGILQPALLVGVVAPAAEQIAALYRRGGVGDIAARALCVPRHGKGREQVAVRPLPEEHGVGGVGLASERVVGRGERLPVPVIQHAAGHVPGEAPSILHVFIGRPDLERLRAAEAGVGRPQEVVEYPPRLLRAGQLHAHTGQAQLPDVVDRVQYADDAALTVAFLVRDGSAVVEGVILRHGHDAQRAVTGGDILRREVVEHSLRKAEIQQLLPELAQYVQQEPGSRGISVNDLQFYSNKMFDEEKLAALNEALAKLN